MSEIKCRICGAVEPRENIGALRNWEMQHFHFSDGDLDFMTCPNCKTISPLEMMEKIKADNIKSILTNMDEL